MPYWYEDGPYCELGQPLGMRVVHNVNCDSLLVYTVNCSSLKDELCLFLLLGNGTVEVLCQLHSPLRAIIDDGKSLFHGSEVLSKCPLFEIHFEKAIFHF